jgi:hypothetical protein
MKLLHMDLPEVHARMAGRADSQSVAHIMDEFRVPMHTLDVMCENALVGAFAYPVFTLLAALAALVSIAPQYCTSPYFVLRSSTEGISAGVWNPASKLGFPKLATTYCGSSPWDVSAQSQIRLHGTAMVVLPLSSTLTATKREGRVRELLTTLAAHATGIAGDPAAGTGVEGLATTNTYFAEGSAPPFSERRRIGISHYHHSTSRDGGTASA